MAGSDAAGRWLAVLVGSVVAAGAGCLVWAARQVTWSDPLAFPVVMTLLVVAAGSGAVVMRIRSSSMLSASAPAVLATVVVLPPGWAVLCVGLGFALAKVLRRQPVHKAAFNTGKEILGVSAAAAAAHTVGLVPASVSTQPIADGWGGYLLGLGTAALAYTVVDELLPPVAIGLATRTRWWQAGRRDLDVRTATRAVDLLLAAAAVALAVVDLWLLVLVPAALLVAYLVYDRLRLREERRAWRRLSAAADAISAASGTGDLDRVLHLALFEAATVFSPAEVEIETATRRLVRGRHAAISYDGPAAQAPPAAPPAGQVVLATNPGGEPIGWLRLWFLKGPARLVDRELDLLHTLAPHLANAISNTTAYASVVSLAERHAHDATHDPLTNLPNRRRLNEHLTTLLNQQRSGPTALMLIELDHFEEVDDTIGHRAGDQMLSEVARRLCSTADGSFVARLGGDEFAVVLHEPTSATATLRAEQVLARLRGAPMDLDGMPISLDASAGLALAHGAISSQELLRRADVALYQAKGLTQPVRLASYQRQLDAGALLLPHAQTSRAVIAERWTLLFQPIVDLGTGRVVSAETFPRWQPPRRAGPGRDHPDHDSDPLPPARLLGALARSGMLAGFVAHMIEQATRAAAEWHRNGHPLGVTVNLTPHSIADPDFPTTVRTNLDAHGLDPEWLTIELTHTAAPGHSTPIDRNLTALREAGIKLALDGFGTGRSTLEALYHLPVDSIKIDRRFVADLLDSAKAAAIVCSIVELGRRFDLPVTAEGVERTDQRQALWEIGCSHGQGRLFSNPQTAKDLLTTIQLGHDHQPGRLAPPLHQDATVIRMADRTGHR